MERSDPLSEDRAGGDRELLGHVAELEDVLRAAASRSRPGARPSPRRQLSRAARARGRSFRPAPDCARPARAATLRSSPISSAEECRGWKQAYGWVGSSPPSGGSSVRHWSVANAHRGANRQASGGRRGRAEGPGSSRAAVSCPGRAWGSRPAAPRYRGGARRGTTARCRRSRPCVRRTSRPRGRPGPAITPMSCVIRMIPMPSSRLSWSSRRRIWAWIVTSSAVVGSSAISSFGSQASAMAIMTRWRKSARQLVGVIAHAFARPGHADHVERLDRARHRRRLGDVAMDADRLGDLAADRHRRVQRGHRVLEDHPDLVAADLADLLVADRTEVAAVQSDLRRRRCTRPSAAGA